MGQQTAPAIGAQVLRPSHIVAFKFEWNYYALTVPALLAAHIHHLFRLSDRDAGGSNRV